VIPKRAGFVAEKARKDHLAAVKKIRESIAPQPPALPVASAMPRYRVSAATFLM
jgi:hypothetical protein